MSLVDSLNATPAQVRVAFTYLFRGMTNQEFRTHFDNGIKTKKIIDGSGYMLLNCKLFAWASFRAESPVRAASYGVSQDDARLLRKLDLSFVPRKYPVWRLGEFTQLVEEQLYCEDMRTYIGKFISRKLVFLIRYYGLKRQDIEAELLIASLYNIYRTFPYFDSPTHVRNVAKMALKRAGQDLISKHTKPSRQTRLSQSIDHPVMLDATALEGYLAAEVPEFDRLEHLRVLGDVYPRCTPKGQRLLSLLFGQPDSGFSEFLGMPNGEAYDAMKFDKYQTKVLTYLNITEAQCAAFFVKIREAASK